MILKSYTTSEMESVTKSELKINKDDYKLEIVDLFAGTGTFSLVFENTSESTFCIFKRY